MSGPAPVWVFSYRFSYRTVENPEWRRIGMPGNDVDQARTKVVRYVEIVRGESLIELRQVK